MPIRLETRLKNKFFIRFRTKTLEVMDGVMEEAIDEMFKPYARGNKKSLYVPEIKISVNKKKFSFIDFFNLTLKLIDIYRTWYIKNVHENLDIKIKQLKELNEIYFLCKSLEYFYKTNQSYL